MGADAESVPNDHPAGETEATHQNAQEGQGGAFEHGGAMLIPATTTEREKDASFSPYSESPEPTETPKPAQFDLGAARWLSKGKDKAGAQRFRLAVGSGLTRQWMGESVTTASVGGEILERNKHEAARQTEQRERVRAHRANNLTGNT